MKDFYYKTLRPFLWHPRWNSWNFEIGQKICQSVCVTSSQENEQPTFKDDDDVPRLRACQLASEVINRVARS